MHPRGTGLFTLPAGMEIYHAQAVISNSPPLALPKPIPSLGPGKALRTTTSGVPPRSPGISPDPLLEQNDINV